MKQDPDVPRLAALIKESGLSDEEIIRKTGYRITARTVKRYREGKPIDMLNLHVDLVLEACGYERTRPEREWVRKKGRCH